MNDLSKQQLTPQLTREDLYNGQIVVFTLDDTEPETIDVWMDACEVIMGECFGEGRPVLIVQDLSNPAAHSTAYFRQRTSHTTTLYPALKGRSAIVLPDTPEAQEIIQQTAELADPNTRERRFFTSRDEAVDWLAELL